MGRDVPERQRRVVALHRTGGAEEAELFLRTARANGRLDRVLVVAIDRNGRQDRRAFGDVTLGDMNWAGACLQHAALHQAGEDE